MYASGAEVIHSPSNEHVADERKLAPPPEPAAPQPPGRGVSRRTFLHRAGLVGATVVVVGAGGVSYRAYDKGVLETGDGSAYDAWRDWEKGGGPLALVSAAILAANPHNSQAWVFHTTPSQIDLFADRTRTIGTIDPFLRELHTGLGCCLENLMLAAPAHGYRAALTLFPTAGQPVHVARIDLVPGPRSRDALYGAIPKRHTDRSAYTAKPVAPATLARMAALAGDLPGTRVYWFSSDAERARVGTLMIDAAVAVTRDEQQSRDGFRLFRSSKDDIEKFKDGLTLDAQGLSALTTAIAKMLPASSRKAGDKFWLDQTRKTHTRTAAAYGIVAVADARDNRQRVTGGRLLERIHLWTAANGLSLQHMNQMTERVDRERQLGLAPRFGPPVQALIPDAGWQPLVTFRIGHPNGTDGRRESPRRPRSDVVA